MCRTLQALPVASLLSGGPAVIAAWCPAAQAPGEVMWARDRWPQAHVLNDVTWGRLDAARGHGRGSLGAAPRVLTRRHAESGKRMVLLVFVRLTASPGLRTGGRRPLNLFDGAAAVGFLPRAPPVWRQQPGCDPRRWLEEFLPGPRRRRLHVGARRGEGRRGWVSVHVERRSL